MNITDSIIKDPLSWEGDGLEYLQLYDGILQVDTAQFKKGDKVPVAIFIFSPADENKKPILELRNDDGVNGIVTEQLAIELKINYAIRI